MVVTLTEWRTDAQGNSTIIVLTEHGFARLIKDLWMDMTEPVIQAAYTVIKHKGGSHFHRNAVGFAYL